MDECFAKFEKHVDGRYRLQVGKQAKTTMEFHGQFEERELRIQASGPQNARPLAWTEISTSIPTNPGARHLKVSVAERVDIGVVVISLIAIVERFV